MRRPVIMMDFSFEKLGNSGKGGAGTHIDLPAAHLFSEDLAGTSHILWALLQSCSQINRVLFFWEWAETLVCGFLVTLTTVSGLAAQCKRWVQEGARGEAREMCD